MSPSSPGITCPSPSIKRCPASAALPLPEWSWATAPPPGASSSPTLELAFFFFSWRRGAQDSSPRCRLLWAHSRFLSAFLHPCPAPAARVSPPGYTPLWSQPSPLPLHFWLGLSSLFLSLPTLTSAAVSPGLGLMPSCFPHPPLEVSHPLLSLPHYAQSLGLLSLHPRFGLFVPFFSSCNFLCSPLHSPRIRRQGPWEPGRILCNQETPPPRPA